MPKKAKVGKQRRDKAYWSAKEIGYRSRASFKLIQLNRKFEFLQKSRVCLDLCAAPGSWMQVAKEHMPLSSLIVGVDLVPIKAIAGCIAIQNDITTDKCRTDLKKELQGWKADLVLHDGAPNVGKSWVHDAYQQSLLTLSSFKLATEFLQKNGTFVTKIFRSKDYSAIIWVLNQFFKRVHATKPAASRNESAEIFVVCQGYKAPDKIDPKFLDPKHVFFEVESATKNENELVNPEKKKRAPAEGYDNQTLLFKQEKASEFIMGGNPIHVLNNCHEIFIDQVRIKKHKKTTPEILECCKDIKVLGMKELRVLKKWREALRADFEKEEKEGKVPEVAEPEEEKEVDSNAEDNSDLEDIQKLEDEISDLKEEERKTAKRLKKKKLKEKRKTAERINLKMIIPGDIGPVQEEEGLFRMKDLETSEKLEKVAEDQEPETIAESDEDEETKPRIPKVEKFARDKGRLDKSGLYYHESDSEEASSSDDSSDEEFIEEKDEESDVDLGPEFEPPPSPTNPLIVDLEDGISRKADEIHAIIRRSLIKAQGDKTLPQETITNGVWAIAIKSILEAEQDFLIKLSCDILESLIRYGWEVSMSGRTTTTPGFEYLTWIFKSATSTALTNAEVVSIVISEESGSLRVVPSCSQMNNVVKRAIETHTKDKKKTIAPKVPEKVKSSSDIEKLSVEQCLIKDGIERKLKPDSSPNVTFARKNIMIKDDPDCPSLFKLEMLKKKSDPGKDDRIVCSNILLEIVHLLFCRQWKIVSSTRLPLKDSNSKNVSEFDVLFFCRDGRILPSLGQQTFAMIELEGPNFVRLYNMKDRVLCDLRDVIQSENVWPEGLVSKEAVPRASNCRELKCRGSPWLPKRRSGSRPEQSESEDKVVDRSTIFANQLVAQMMLAMNRNEFNLFSAIQLGPPGGEKKNHLIFKHSSVRYEEAICLHLSGQNKVVLIGGGEAEISAIRHTLTSRWPYPISIDRALNFGKDSRTNRIWLFKVKRYPWAVSYGNKYLDRTIEWTRSFLRSRQVPIPSPQNSDSESGKSILVFLLKELMNLGWRIQTSADISSNIFNTNRNVQPRLSDPHSIFLMR